MPKIIAVDDLNTDAGSGYAASFLYSYSQPPLNATVVARDGESPLVTAVSPGLNRLQPFWFAIENTDGEEALRTALFRALDTTAGPKSLTIADDDDGNPRYMMIVVEKVDQQASSRGLVYVVSAVSSEDVRWRAADETEQSWTVTASAQTQVVANDGDLDAFPTWAVTPRGAKSGPNFIYSRQVIVRWVAPRFAPNHPICITSLTDTTGWNTAALVSGGKVTDAANIAVMVDGVIVPHWYGAADGEAKGFNNANTFVWINAPFRPNADLTATGAASSVATTIPARSNENLLSSGLVYVPSTGELFTYNGRDGSFLYNCRRGVSGTTAAALSPGDAMDFISHDIRLLYGPSAAIPEWAEDDYYAAVAEKEPLMTFSSVNGSSSNSLWFYEEFRDGLRTGEWRYVGRRDGGIYTEETDATAVTGDFTEPWTAMGFKSGIRLPTRQSGARGRGWQYEKDFAMAYERVKFWVRRVANGYQIDYPGLPALYVMSEDGALRVNIYDGDDGNPSTTANNLLLVEQFLAASLPLTRLEWAVDDSSYVQADIQRMWIEFKEEDVPEIIILPEETIYDLSLRLENVTTGEFIDLALPMELNESLAIDSYYQTAVYSGDDSNQYAAVRRDAIRPRFLRLAPGDNTIKVTETGLTDVDIDVSFRERFYS